MTSKLYVNFLVFKDLCPLQWQDPNKMPEGYLSHGNRHSMFFAVNIVLLCTYLALWEERAQHSVHGCSSPSSFPTGKEGKHEAWICSKSSVLTQAKMLAPGWAGLRVMPEELCQNCMTIISAWTILWKIISCCIWVHRDCHTYCRALCCLLASRSFHTDDLLPLRFLERGWYPAVLPTKSQACSWRCEMYLWGLVVQINSLLLWGWTPLRTQVYCQASSPEA